MGIKDLLRFMKPHVEPIHIKKYAGKRVGIDAYSWLHKGAYSCSMELCLNTEGEKKFQYLNYFMHRINLLRHYKVTPVVVFDGQNIPCKAATEHDRSRRRKANRDLAMAKLKEGNVAAATELFQRAVSISPSMAHQLIQILRSEDIEFVVAPYEADAQLAYLSGLEAEKGGIAGIISEDSDLLAYGCPSIIFKMDRFGNGEEIVLSMVFETVDKVPSFQHLNMEVFTGMCVLAGCDFLPSVPGIGIAKAYSLVSKYRNLDRALSMLKFEKGSVMPEDYIKSFREAFAVFQHALVYDANSKSLKHLKPLSEKFLQSLDGDHDFLGPDIPQSIAIAIAEGNLDPSTMEAFDHFPSSKIHLKSTIAINPVSYKLPKIDTTTISEEESCFSVISSRRTNKGRIFRSLKEEPNFSKEVAALEKLVCPFNTLPTGEGKACRERSPLKIPKNNPFKKRKADEVQLDKTEIITEQVSVLTEADTSDILCETPGSQKMYRVRGPLKRPENNPFKKKKVDDIQLDETEIITKQVSSLTEVDASDILSETPESQKSVNSKPLNKTKKAKKEINKSSILNFFRRV